MLENTKPQDKDTLISLSTEQLSEMLRLDCEDIEPLDVDTIYTISAILAERRKAEGGYKSAEEAYQTFLKHYYPRNDAADPTPPLFVQQEKAEKKRNGARPLHILGRIAAVAALVLILTSFVPAAMGTENVFTILGNWTDDIFSFMRPQVVQTQTLSDLENLQSVVNAICRTDSVVPTWLPDGYTLSSIESYGDTECSYVFATFAYEDDTITFQYTSLFDDSSISYEKDDENVETYLQGDQTYYIMENNDTIMCIWATANTECHIFGNISKDTLYEIIKSIPTKE